MALQDTSLIWKILVVIQTVGLLLSVTGFGASNHVQGHGSWSKFYIGLWEKCIGKCENTQEILDKLRMDDTWLSASKVMMGVAWGSEVAVLGLTLLAFVMTLSKLIGFATAALALLSAVFGLIGMGVLQVNGKNLFNKLTVNIEPEAGWAFYVFLIGQLIYVVAAGLHILDSRRRAR